MQKQLAGNINHRRCFRLSIVLFSLVMAYQAFGSDEVKILSEKQPFLTSPRLINAVLVRNPNILAMKATWQAAKAHITQTESIDSPMISYSLAPQTINDTDLSFGQNLTLSQRLSWAGKRNLRGDIARTQSDIAFIGIEQMRLMLTETSKAAYIDWYFVHAAIRINQRNQSLLKEFQHIAEIKYSAGRTSRQDALHAEVEMVRLEHQYIVLEHLRRDTLAKLNTLLQRLPDQPLAPPGGLPKRVTLASVEKLRELALKNQPELLTLAAKKQASTYKEQLVKSSAYPDITFNAAYNTLWNQQEKHLSLGASLKIPLMSQYHAEKDEARALTQRIGFQQQAKRSQVIGDVQRAMEKVHESEQLLDLYKKRLLPLAEENLNAALSNYEAGSGDFLDLIYAEKYLMQTRLQHEQTRADYHQRFAALEYVIGGSIGHHPGTNKL